MKPKTPTHERDASALGHGNLYIADLTTSVSKEMTTEHGIGGKIQLNKTESELGDCSVEPAGAMEWLMALQKSQRHCRRLCKL